MKSYFKLFSCCIPVRGYLRSVLYDLQRKNYLFIPNLLFDILNDSSNKTIFEVLQMIDEDEREQVEKYFSYLIENEFIFLCSKENLECFPPLDLSWESSAEVDSIIIDIGKQSDYNFKNIISDISKIRPKVIQIRIFTKKSKIEVADIVNAFSNVDTRSLEIILPLNEDLDIDSIKKIIDENRKIVSIVITDYANGGLSDYKHAKICFTQNKINSESDCGVIDKAYFICDLNTFSESHNFNTCLNQKISIDINGNIKNCPSCKQSFGNIKDTSLLQALKNSSFKKLWSITKAQIDVCKDCEFKYLCTDCRAHIKDTENIYSQPANCCYNPYIAKWKGEEGYVPVEECGSYSTKTGFIINKEKIEALHLKLWGF